MSNSSIEKRAFDKEKFVNLLKKYGKQGLAAGVLAAGVGAYANRSKAKKVREAANNIAEQRNAITIHVNKDNFLEGLPTPEEFANSQVAAAVNGEKVASVHKFDFFNKKASCGKAEKPVEKSEIAKKERIVVRDQSGKFAGQTDKVEVSKEKKAEYDVLDNLMTSVIHPIETLKGMEDAATVRPTALAAGALTSILVSSYIIDMVKKVRERRAKERLNSSRSKYINLLEGGEKAAQAEPGFQDTDNIMSLLAGVAGGSFIIPAALSALVVNRIIQQRKAEKKKEKMESDSYPDEPYIVYKTAEGKDMPISPETALASMVVKRAMFECVEAIPVEKSAEIFPSQKGAVSRAVELMSDPANNEHLLNMIKGYYSGGSDPAKSFKKMLGWGDKLKYGNIFDTGKFKRSLLTDKRIHDLILSRFNDDNYKDSFGAYRDQIVSDEVGRTFRKGSILHKLFSQVGQWQFDDKLKQSLPQKNTPSQTKA